MSHTFTETFRYKERNKNVKLKKKGRLERKTKRLANEIPREIHER
jgi:hypothetical protein